ncbi:MAG: carbohydrate kinase family protein [Caldilineaceae bacterium]
MNQYDVLVVGEINADLILGDGALPVFGQVETLVEDATLTIGASGAIFACGCARLGLHVAYCGIVGDDIFGHFMVDSMQARGVDPAGIIVDPDMKTGLSVILNNGGDRAILTHLGTIDKLAADRVDRALLASASHVHVTSYFLQQALRPGLAALLAEARAVGATVSIDTNWDPAEEWDHGLQQVLALTDVFLPNAQEAVAISGETTLEAAERHLSEIVPVLALKLGADGARCRCRNTTLTDPGFSVTVVDTTGAGDSFDAGFVCGYVNKWPTAETLELATACGALSTRAAGGTEAQPTLREAQELIDSRRKQSRNK